MAEHSTSFCRPEGIYLLSHSVGLAPIRMAETIASDFLLPWQQDTAQVWDQWLLQIEGFREALARLFNHQARNFCPQQNISSAATKVIQSLPRRKTRNRILLSEQAFPSLGYVAGKANSGDYALKFIESSEDCQDPAVWEKYLTDDVELVLITHVHSNTGQQLPVEQITAIARRKSIRTMDDIAQSAGILPIDLTNWAADFVSGSCVKWLCGGPGAGFLWVNPERLDELEPKDVGWFSHANPFEFDIHRFEYAGDALQFWGGTPSVLPYVVARKSIDLIRSIGVATIRAHNISLSEKIIAQLDDDRLVSPRSAARRSGTVVIKVGRDRELVTKLKASQIHFDTRAEGIRVSPHIYNSDDELEALLACL